MVLATIGLDCIALVGLSVVVDCRHAMLPVMLNHVNDLMMFRFELELCIKIISDIVDLLFETNRLVRTSATCPYLSALAYTRTHTHTRLTALHLGLPGWAGTRKVKPIWIYWSKRQWVAVASAGLYASMHLAPGRWRQHPATQYSYTLNQQRQNSGLKYSTLQ